MDANARGWRRWVSAESWLLVLALVPAGLGWSSLHSEAESTTPPTAQAALTFESHLSQAGGGDNALRSELSGRFRFRNTSDRPVSIDRVHLSCGCLSHRISSQQLRPGEPGELILTVATANESPGIKEFSAIVHYHDPEPREERLKFRVAIPARSVTVRPRALLFYQFGEGTTRQTIEVTDERQGKRLQIVGAEVRGDLITVNPLEANADAGIHRFEATVSGAVPTGRHQSDLILRTDDPDFPELVVPIVIQGPPVTAARPDAAKVN